MKADYSKGFIYKLCCLDPIVSEIYVGSSVDFKGRRRTHKCACTKEGVKDYDMYVYQFIRDHGGWDNWRMVVLHDFPCGSKKELEQEETRVILELHSELNKRVPYVSKEEKRTKERIYVNNRYANDEEFREKRKQASNEFYSENKEEINQKKKVYRDENKEKINARRKVYRDKNKEEINAKRRVKVVCEYCKCEVGKYYLKKHQESAKCLECQK